MAAKAGDSAVRKLFQKLAAEERLKQGYEFKDWYFCMKKL
jgi:hypothetical protein